MLNALVAILKIYFTIFVSTPKMIFVRNLSTRSIIYIYLASILQWLTLPQNFIQQSPELRFYIGSNLACGMLQQCNGENLTVVLAGNKA